MQGAQVQSLVGELRSHMLHGEEGRKEREKEREERERERREEGRGERSNVDRSVTFYLTGCAFYILLTNYFPTFSPSNILVVTFVLRSEFLCV